MSGLETRSVSRDSLFLLADIKVEQDDQTHRVRVRNLSDGGMMGEGSLRVKRGNRLQIEMRSIGRINGTVAWIQDNRFGIAFDEQIDSQQVLRAEPVNDEGSAISVERSWRYRPASAPDQSALRKV